jgi:hypothetical protein
MEESAQIIPHLRAELPSIRDLACTNTATAHSLLWHAEVKAATHDVAAVTEERGYHLAGIVSHKDWEVITIEPGITEWSPIVPARPPEPSGHDVCSAGGGDLHVVAGERFARGGRVTIMVPPAPKGCV